MEGRFTLIQLEKEFIAADNIKGLYTKLEHIQQRKGYKSKK
jgi:hypothetical protein